MKDNFFVILLLLVMDRSQNISIVFGNSYLNALTVRVEYCLNSLERKPTEDYRLCTFFRSADSAGGNFLSDTFLQVDASYNTTSVFWEVSAGFTVGYNSILQTDYFNNLKVATDDGLIRGGEGNDFIRGEQGNDTFRIKGGSGLEPVKPPFIF